MNPILWLRTYDNSLSDMEETSVPPRMYLPCVGRSSPPNTFSSVLLPLPEAPMMATKSPVGKSMLTPRKAFTRTAPRS